MYVLYGSCISAYFLIFFLQVYTSPPFSNNQYHMYYMYVCAVWQLYICIFSYFLFLQVYTSLLFSNNQYHMCYLYVCAVWQLYICIFSYFLFCRFIQVCSSAIINTICTICMYVLYGSCISAYFLISFFFFCRFIQVCPLAIINTISTLCMYVLYGSCISAYFLIFFLQVYTSLLFSNNQYYMYYMYVCAVWQLYICIFSYFLFAGLYKSALQQ